MSILDRLFESKEAKDIRLAKKAQAKQLAEAARIRQEQQQLLDKAICSDDISSVKRLVDGNPSLITAQNKFLPLHRACLNSHKEIVTLLLERKADVHAKDTMGDTPLHKAAFGGCHEIAALLLQNGADVNARSNVGYTPIHSVVNRLYNFEKSSKQLPVAATEFINGGPLVLELLIKHGAEVNATNMFNTTPLQMLKDSRIRNARNAGALDKTLELILRKFGAHE